MSHSLTDVQRLEALGAEADVAFQMDEQTFRAFYDRTARPLWAYLSRVTGDRQLADDLLQDAYYRFLRADASYENETHRRNALFRIATNLARDAHRRTLVRPRREGDDEKLATIADRAGYMVSPTARQRLGKDLARNPVGMSGERCIEPLPQDRRFLFG